MHGIIYVVLNNLLYLWHHIANGRINGLCQVSSLSTIIVHVSSVFVYFVMLQYSVVL